MRTPYIYILSSLFLVSNLFAQSNSFRTFDRNKVPIPKDFEPTEEYRSIAEFLADVAVSKNVSKQGSAQLLAAALRLQPSNKKAFFTEYELSIGARPTLAKQLVGSTHSTEIQLLKILQGPQWKSFNSFVDSSARDLSIDRHIVPPHTTCSVLTLKEGPIAVSIEKNRVYAKGFQFAPQELDTSYFQSAYREVIKYNAQSYSSQLNGYRYTFKCDEKIDSEEGPVAALAAAVLSRSMITNQPIDARVCLSGDVNADGSVQPLNDQRQRMIASEERPEILVIPNGDRYAADDSLVFDGVLFFVDCQVFEVGTVDEAFEISLADRDEKLKKAMTLYAQIQKVLKGADGKKYFNNNHVRKRLEMVLELAPNHVSAQQVMRVSKRDYPKYLSLYESFDLVFSPLEDLYDSKKEEFKSAQSLDAEALARLEKYKERIDPNLQGLTQAVFGYKSSERALGADTAKTKARLLKKLKQELSTVSTDVRIKERMMR